MAFSSYEADVRAIYVMGQIAKGRLDRGVKLNMMEAEAIIMAFIIEGARDGHSVAELAQKSTELLKNDQVMEGVQDLLAVVSCTGSFPDGHHEVVVIDPIRDPDLHKHTVADE